MAKPRRLGRLLFWLLLLSALAAGAWYHFLGRPAAPPRYQTTVVQRGAITQAVTATGQLQPVMIVDVGSQVSGRIIDLLVDFNSTVKAGEVLARIDTATFEAAVSQAENELLNARANLRLQRSNLERSRQLFEQNLVSSAALEQLEATVEQAEASVKIRESALVSRRTDLERCTILAPIDGIVISRNVQRGQTVAASLNAPVLFTIANDLTKMQIAAAVSEADVGSIQEGQEVTFTVDAFAGRTFTGAVSQVRNSAKSIENVITYETIIDVANPGGRLKPGMTANVSIIVARRDEALRLANAARRMRLPPELQPPLPPEPERPPGGPPGEGPAGGRPGRAGGEGGGDPERRARFQAMMAANPEMAARVRERFSQGGAPSSRVVYLLQGSETAPAIVAVRVRTGIGDGSFTEVVDGIEEGAKVLTSVILPGATPAAAAPVNNPFGGGGRGGPGGFRGF